MKYQFLQICLKEIQFEYTATPEMLMLSEWGRLSEFTRNDIKS